MKLVRWLLGRLILLFDFLFRPKGIKRSVQEQVRVDEQSKNLALYQFNACPFCVKVRRAMKRLSVNVELRDAKNDEKYREELLSQGGKSKVPCLRIEQNGEVKWLYESSDIVHYLENQFQPM
ncbi:glutathione S-transferase N-terminal domain-containing protein [Vibrio sp. S4M6]|uniref:glutaredoxin family protein n=1 Tax=Vibrio sinus TaxID=2946865 RepID=UPI00202A4B73|nr:glutathione S-transferase N-terminal domain-containing protein [Vibrio sinus]MCL9780073.1 glutathione S-transferase N-terminal domain-containing protein [Vibrio sinus]